MIFISSERVYATSY